MSKEKRIERIGKALQSIDTALQSKDLTELPADTLLKLKLKYEQELKTEYAEPSGADFSQEELKIDEVITALSSLYRKIEGGEISPAQAKAQLSTLTSLLTAYSRKEAESWIGAGAGLLT